MPESEKPTQSYLVTMRPLEPYTFGTEQNIAYPGDNVQGRKNSYYVGTNLYPEQTTILGLIRYLILMENGKLRTDKRYDDSARKEIANLIGENSFSFGENVEKNDNAPLRFGRIKRISPLFAMIGEGEESHTLIRVPAFFTDNGELLQFDSKAIITNWGELTLPSNYNPKSGLKSGLFDLNVKAIRAQYYYETEKDPDGNTLTVDPSQSGLFKKTSFVGINKQLRDDGFFRRETVMPIDSTFRFAVYVELEELEGEIIPTKCVAYMGKRKSAFLIESKQVSEANGMKKLEKDIKVAFQEERYQGWNYAFSDLLIKPEATYSDFCVVERKSLRNLSTSLENGTISLSPTLTHLARAGSVFRGTIENLKENVVKEDAIAELIGYNHIITF